MQERHTITSETIPSREVLQRESLENAPANLWYGPEDVSTRRPRDAAEKTAVGLGWFSLGLGITQIVAPGAVARWIGASDGVLARGVMRACGVREVVTGLGILMQPRPNTFLWGRVAGDVLDLGLLTAQLATRNEHTGRLSLAAALVGGVTALDAQTAMDLQRARRGQDLDADGVHVKQSITINAPREQVYSFWRDLENLPKFMAHLESVKVHNGKSVWCAKAPAGQTVEWEAEVTSDEPNSKIAWRSLEGATIPNHGCVYFVAAPGDRGTEVHVELTYEPPGGAFGALIAKLFGEEPKEQIKSDLRRLKQVIETGEVTRSDSSIHRGLHAARPPEHRPPLPPMRPKRGNGGASKAARPGTANAPSGEAYRPGETYRAGQAHKMPSAPQAKPSVPSSSAPPKPGAPANRGVANTGSGESTDNQPATHFTNQGFGTTRDDDAS